MAGERPLPIQEYCDDSQILTFGPYAAAAVGSADTGMYIADRDHTIDHITVRCGTKPSIAATIIVEAAGAGVAIGSGDALSDAYDLNGITNATNTALTLTSTAAAGFTENRVQAGDAVSFVISSAATALVDLMITVRIRSKIR